MRVLSVWQTNSRRLTLLLLAVAVPPAATLVWLGMQLLAQERSLLAQRDLELRQVAMQGAIRSLEQSLADLERRSEGPLPEGVVRFRMTAEQIDADPPDRVLWLPTPRSLPAADDGQFVEAERLEFRGREDEAERLYRDAARSPLPAVRAGALLRSARVLRRQQRADAALAAYRDLATIDTATIAGAPADFQARRAICAVLEEAHRTDALRAEALRLREDFLAGRWRLDQPAWELTAAEIERWTGNGLPALGERRQFSAVASLLWTERPHIDTPRGLLVVDQVPMTIVSRGRGAAAETLAVSPSVVRHWADAAISGARLSVLAVSGEVVAGAASTTAGALRAAPSESGLPWLLQLESNGTSAAHAEFANRRRLLAIGLVAMLLLLAGGSYFLWRVMQRELAVARLQTEFVSAVSHEFRTPLTSMRHVTELLSETDDMPRDRRRTFYEALDRNTDRLHRLVESLLDFARMEGGRKSYDFAAIDAGQLAAEVVADFQKVAPRGFTIDVAVDPAADLGVRADASSLTNALWNLLDNAVKYSAEPSPVGIGLERRNGHVAISVRDHGIGIPDGERAAIFDKFHRGEQARRLGIKGTGIGLAMVSEIIRAHGGWIDVDSETGRGSTFTIVLPANHAVHGGRP